ncbi:MAG: acido-empty-quinoprotein group A, partial [Bryobacteraceae bacterium]
ADSWLTFHGAYSGERHTSLTQITPENVSQLQQVWRFDTHQNQQIKASPIVANGVIYITTPDNIWAMDARTARQLWHYQNPPNNAFHIGHRGAAIYKDTVYLTTPDCHLIALNAKDGKVKWNVVIADSNKGYWSTNAPLIVRNHVLVGVSGDFDNLPGQLKSIDADTGETQWIFYSTHPPDRNEPNSGGATGGQMWTTGTYDPSLNLVYVGTGNPTPVLNGEARPGDNPWTCSIVALNPDTGKLVWGFQVSPHDTHDWDANEVPVLVDANFNGAPRKLLMQASRNGYFFVLDRTKGKSLLTTPFATVNWAKGIDPQGRPIPNPAKFPQRSGVLVAPNETGATNFRPPSFDPQTGLFIVSAQDGYGIYFFKPEHGAYGWAGADYGVAGRAFLRAIDYHTGKIVWNHPIGDGAGTAGVLTTATGLTFSGDVSGNAMALRSSDGATLWHQSIQRIGNAPISYELDGRQYLVVGGGSSLYAFALPSAAAQIRSAIRPPIRVMLLDGESAGPYHKWQLTTPVLRKELEETSLFQVDVVAAPPAGGDFSAFHPDFAKYSVVVWNYDAPDERWPADLKASFENYVRGGGGFVSVHASDNAFPNWPAFNEMIGVGGWRGRTEKNGPFWYF